MKKGRADDLSSLSMLELFQVEVERQTATISDGLLAIERQPADTRHLEEMMRAAHSLKGAARIVNHDDAVNLAHAMEDCFVAAQQGKIHLARREIDLLFQGVDLLLQISRQTGSGTSPESPGRASLIRDFLNRMSQATSEGLATLPVSQRDLSVQTLPAHMPQGEGSERYLRLTADNLNRLLGLAGESLVESRWLHPFTVSMVRLKRMQAELIKAIDDLRDSLEPYEFTDAVDDRMNETLSKAMECRQFLSERVAELEMFDRRSANLSHRLYLEVLQCRMRPFGEGARRFPRMVRDLGHALGKRVRLEIIGENTQVDRDILERLEAPLAHLLRNAVDHGCESPAERIRAGKPEECVIRLEARHSAGMLTILVADDGAGIHQQALRETIIRRRLTTPAMVEKLSEHELLDFLLLPGFSMRDTVTEFSGRGVGLDVVQNMVKNVRGHVRISTQPGKGTRFQLHLPLTLSVMRTLLVEVGGEPYAIPLSQISRTMKLPRARIESLEGRHYFAFGGQHLGLLTAHQLFDCGEPQPAGDELCVVILGERNTLYGLVVDAFLGERELVVQALDSRLGKVRDISAGALMEDGSPVLIVDVEDMMRSVEKLITAGRLEQVQSDAAGEISPRAKRILAVDDSMTVREMERKLLAGHGYLTDVAVDGMDGWNAVRAGRYDLVITDVDMPRMDGIELARLIKKDPRLNSLPVMIVSYKDRDEDRLRGLEAGADYYLTKGSFHDETLLAAVKDLIGESEA